MMLGEPRHSNLFLQTQAPARSPLHHHQFHHHDLQYLSPPPSPVDSTPLHRYLLLLSSTPDGDGDGDDVLEDYTSDEFRMYEFKVRRCPRGRSHDWTECPFAHPGEKARRRDPRRHRYSGAACPDFRRGSCRKGDSCELAHGVFECWLHPSRYRTQPCKDGINCRRRVCFFAHTHHQLRHVEDHHYSNYSPPSPSPLDSYDGSPLRRSKVVALSSSSPPPSPTAASQVVLASALRRLQLSWGVPAKPRAAVVGFEEEEEEEVERVESGRGLRARIAEMLSRENPLEGTTPDVDWVSDLLD